MWSYALRTEVLRAVKKEALLSPVLCIDQIISEMLYSDLDKKP